MSMLIRMVTKNIYVSEQDLPLLTEATRYADNLSEAVVRGLRLFLILRRIKSQKTKNIELVVSSNGREIIKSSRVKESSNLVIVLPGKGTLRRYS